MKKSILLPLVSTVMSVVFFFLRKSQIAGAKNPETLLFTDFAPETIMLTIALVLFHLILFGMLFTGARDLPNYKYTVYCPSQLFIMILATGSLILILSVFIGIMDIMGDYKIYQDLVNQTGVSGGYKMPIFEVLGILFGGATGAVMLFLGKNAYRGEELETRWFTTIPAFLALVCLVSVYQNFAVLPNFQEKFYPIMSTFAMVYAYYNVSASSYETPRPRRISFFALSSIALFGVYAGYGISFYHFAVYLGMNIYLLGFSYAVMENAYTSREDYRTPPANA